MDGSCVVVWRIRVLVKPLNNEEPKEQRRKRIKAANDSSGIVSYAICTLKGRPAAWQHHASRILGARRIPPRWMVTWPLQWAVR